MCIRDSININRDPKKRRRPVRPDELNPYSAKRRRKGVKGQRTMTVGDLTNEIMDGVDSRRKGKA